jgi:GT2 family glycosyltransferase
VKVSVVIITHNEAPRLALALESFALQRFTPCADGTPVTMELVVVDDASTDDTPRVLREAGERMPLRVLRHEVCQNRSPSRNAGAALATGDVLLFFDGDVLVGPDVVALHGHLHQAHPGSLGRGDGHHLRCTRFFHDPETGTPMPGAEERVAKMRADELRAALVTRAQVRERFEEVVSRAEPSIYPGAGPRKLYELETRALSAIPDSSILWMTACGHNFSVPRAAFAAAGGFDARLSMNEHRELALRLCERGSRMAHVTGARSFHLTHRVGWRDPTTVDDWEQVFHDAHPGVATRLMSIFWLSLAGDREIPEEARILSLEQLDTIVREGTSFDYDTLRRRHPKLTDLALAETC